MELSILHALLSDTEFYKSHRGTRCPDELFTKDARLIKRSIDKAMDRYNRNLTVDEVESLFFSDHPTMTTATRTVYKGLFDKLREQRPMGEDIANDVLSKLFQQYVGEKVANIGFDIVNDQSTNLDPIRRLLEQYNDDFTPTLNIEWDEIDIDSLLERNELETQWKFNVATLGSRIEGVNAGHLIEVGARPNTGKTSFHASLIASPNGFAHQGARCVVLCNEEATHRVAARYLTAATGMTLREIREDKHKAEKLYAPVRDNIWIKDATGRDLHWVESVCKTMQPDILVLDMGDKFAPKNGSFAREDQKLEATAVHSRMIAKEYGCAVFYMSQLSAEAEGKIVLNQSMMQGSKTGKAAEADLMLLIAKNPPIDDGAEEQDPQRHVNITKNKLNGWHGIITCTLNHVIGRYEV